MLRLSCFALAVCASLAAPAFAQQAKIAELERKIADLDRKVRDVERQRDDAKRERDDAKRDKDRVNQTVDAKVRAATQQADALRTERDALIRKFSDHESKVRDAAMRTDADIARLQRERDDQKQLTGALLDIAKKELLKRPAVQDDPKLREQIEKADAKTLSELYQRLK